MAQGPAQSDAKAYYGYLFEPDKKPSRVLDALLRGIATYVCETVGDTTEKQLTPQKLATFYKAVGGNYDSLFVDLPSPSISWIYASIGCQHILLPTADDFQPPCIPALTTKGFVRWQSIEILLGPEEHVPFIQNAVTQWPITHPETGELFPKELPSDAFPEVPDAQIEKWHNACAEKLRMRASPPTDDGSESPGGVRPHLPPRPKVQGGFAHVRVPPRRDPDYFEREPKSRTRPTAPVSVSYQHVHGPPPVANTGRPVRPTLSRSPGHRQSQFLAPEDHVNPERVARARRRSLPGSGVHSPMSPSNEPSHNFPVQPDGPDSTLPTPEGNPGIHARHVRRHSHPRQHHNRTRRGSMSSDASSSSDGESLVAPRARSGRRSNHGSPGPGPPPVAVRYSVPGRGGGRLREDPPEKTSKRQSFINAIPIDLSGKLSAPFLLGKRDRGRHRDKDGRDDKRRSRSREDRNNTGSGGSSGNIRWKDLDGAELYRRSEDDSEGRRFSSRERDHKRRDRAEGPRLRDRGSSYEEGPRVRDRRDRDEREREAVPVSRGGSRSYRDRDRERDAERDRERYRDRREPSPVQGVGGRRYPGH